MLAAIARDLQLPREQALDRLATELAASRTEITLRDRLGAAFAGAWLDGQQRLVVAVTDLDHADDVRAAGAVPRHAIHSEQSLDRTRAALDRARAPDPDQVYAWYVDVMTNRVVVEAAPGATGAARAWAARHGVDRAMLRVVEVTTPPRPLADLIGGYPYFTSNSRCSIGFSVRPNGFVTAGHCGQVGTSTRGYNQAPQGVFAGSIFPGRDMAYVATNANWTPRPWVYLWDGTAVVVSGSAEAAINATVCRSGSSTGYYCGQITHKNQTVNYAQGTVFGLTRTTVCAGPGDSGGSFIAAGIHAQGVTSGGSGNCTVGGITFFQPINPILAEFGLTLVTG